MAISLFLHHNQSFRLDRYEVPISVDGQGPQRESPQGGANYVNIHNLSPLDEYEVLMR